MKIISEEQILQQGFRKDVISEMIDGIENISRKNSDLRKHEIYRDQNRKWVIEALHNEGFKHSTLAQMENRASNISIARKIVNKLAQTYIGGVERFVDDKASLESIGLLADELDVDTVFKKSDRYRQLLKNTMLQAVPVRKESGLWNIILKVLASWEYDIIEDGLDNEKAKVVILTDFPERHRFHHAHHGELAGSQGFRSHGHTQGETHHGGSDFFKHGDRKQQIIADSPGDKGIEDDKRTFIWWSDHFHFTTNSKGIIVDAPDKNINPIGMMPFIDLHGDQDGNYWAMGGEDVIEGSIGINKKITDRNFIEFTQGWGQLVIAAKDVPKLLKGGPDNAFVFDVQPDDPTPTVFYATSNPNLEAWNNGIKMDLALLLSTNDLSPRNISANLDSAGNFPSGISLIIEQSEVIADVQDVQKLYQDKEPIFWEILRRWHGLFADKNLLVPNLQSIPVYADSNVKVKFHTSKLPVSEKEKLEVLRLRKDLGLSNLTDLIKMDNPDLSPEEAEAKAKAIMAEKKANAAQFGVPAKENEEQEPKEPQEDEE